MFVSPEEILSNPKKHLLHSRGGFDSPLSPFDGRVGTILPCGKYFVTSPWEGYIPHVHMETIEVQLRTNWGFGADDIIQWPQPFHPRFCHYSVILSKPRDPLHMNNKWWSILRVDDFPLSPSDKSIGSICRHLLRDVYLPEVQSILARVERHKIDPKRAQVNDAVAALSALLTCSYDRMHTMSLTFRHASILLAKFQREFLELQAALDYLELYLPLMNGTAIHTRIPPRADVLGTILYGPHIDVADRFFCAGIPYWIVWPLSELPKRRIDCVVALTNPSDYCCVVPAPCSTVIHRCRMADEAKYDKIAAYYNSRLTSPNPFALEKRPTHQPVPKHAARSKSFSACRAQQTFREPDHPAWPPAPLVWVTALSSIDVGMSRDKWIRGYILPDPKLFVRANVDLKRIVRYLRWRTHLIHRLTLPDTRPISNQLWRTFLATGLAVTNRKLSEADKERAKVANLLDADPSMDNDDALPPLWEARHYSLHSPPPDTDIALILWEMNEINLRCEMVELHTVLANRSDPFFRVASVEGCFPGEGLWKPDFTSIERGLGASTPVRRAPCVYALAQLMSCWKGGEQFQYTRTSPFVEAAAPAQESDRDKLEIRVANFYAQCHFSVFNRAACLPRHI